MANISAAKQELVLKSIGERLKKARESKGLSLEQARIKTRIHPRVLTALEDGRIDEVLDVTYAKGFLKKYAEFLGLRGEDVLKDYISLHQAEKAQAPAKTGAPRAALKLRNPAASDLYSRGVIAAIVVIALVSLIVYFKSHRPRPGPAAVVVRKAAPTAPASLAKRSARPPLSVSSKKARTTTAPLPQRSRPAAGQASQAKGFSFIPLATSKNAPITLTLKIKRNVLIEISKDGYTLFGYVLRGGIVETVKAREKIVLSVGNISAVELSLNGRSLVIPRKGEVKNMEITRGGVRIK